MSFRVPKATKNGGLPNISFEPRKPRPLGTELKDSVISGPNLLVFTDPQKNSEQNFQKEYSQDLCCLPGRERDFINAATSTVMRQIDGCKLAPGGGLIGDAGFGSVEAVVHAKKFLGRNSFFVVKNSTYLFPKTILQSILKSRRIQMGNELSGTWVTMRATICGVNVNAMAYAWGFDLTRVSEKLVDCYVF